jgi:hypothetical protein
MFRRYLLALLVLALPFNGWAVAREPEPCPMKASAMADHMAMKARCCKDDVKPGKPLSDPCKPGQECQTGAMYFVTPFSPAVAVSLAGQPALLPDSQLASTAPSGVWRPPRV